MNTLESRHIMPLSVGGTILGGGGGGESRIGIDTARKAFESPSAPTLIQLDDLADDDLVLTISAVGAPSAEYQHIDYRDYVNVIDIFERNAGGEIKALIANEMGGISSFNPFVPSAFKGIPLIDGACNGRAHPLGTMGAMRLAEKGYESVQAVSGGKPQTSRRVEMWTRGSIESASALVRQAAVAAGGLVVVARNPVTKRYLAENAALGCLSQSCAIGEAHMRGSTPSDKIANVLDMLGGRIVCEGAVSRLVLEIRGGLDWGRFDIVGEADRYRTYIWNEYMAVDFNGERLSTFPDLIMTFDKATGRPLTSAELSEGREVVLAVAPRSRLRLGSGMSERSGYAAIEEALQIAMVPYVQELIY
ncbi:DUF917 family protein [Cohnella hongkongensis]|uniref:DUF917 family protein n=1 Tax=Cohnella hongkongensis TaxID=178337 RepID=A0ABV9F7V7_9BACL